MKKKALSLALALVMCLGLSIPALAAPDSVEELLKNISFMRGAYDEKDSPFASGKTVQMFDYNSDEAETISTEYSVVSKDDSWTLTHTGGAEYTVWLLCNTYEKNEEGIFDMAEHRAWRGSGFVDTALQASEEYGFVTELKPGESLTFSAEDLRYAYYATEEAWETGVPTAEDKGSGDYLYEVYIMMDYPEEDTTKYLYTCFMIDEAKTAEIKAELAKAPAQPDVPAQPQQPSGTPAEAMPTNDKLTVDGAAAEATVYKIDGSNYFKIRDMAALLNGTEKQFSVGYDNEKKSAAATTGQSYDKQAGDLAGAADGGSQAAAVSNDTIYVDGQQVDAQVYKINGSNYFKLRDLGKALNFYVGWSREQGMYIETDKPYSE